MGKEAFIEAHEEMIADALEAWVAEHPEATVEQRIAALNRIYDETADGAYDRMRDNLADMADHYRQMKKDGMI